MSRLTASSMAHSAACIAAFEPSIPTTTDGRVADSFIAPLSGLLGLVPFDRHAWNAIGPRSHFREALVLNRLAFGPAKPDGRD